MSKLTELGRILAIRRMSYQELSTQTGLSVETLQNLACGNNVASAGRVKVEAALGVEIWSQAAMRREVRPSN